MRLLVTFILNVYSFAVYSQKTDNLETPSNSFEKNYFTTNPTLIYTYDEIFQVHNYSHNWDFDNDGLKDELYFVGTGGAHIYYFLRIVLSSDKKVRDLNFIQSDFPLLTATDTLNSVKSRVGFTINKLGKELTPTIILSLDESTYYTFKLELMKQKIETRNCSISFKNGETKFGCF